MFWTEPFSIVYVQYEYILFYFVLFIVLCFNLETRNKDWYCGNITASACVSCIRPELYFFVKKAKKKTNIKWVLKDMVCSKNIYLVLLFLAGVWPVSASERLSNKLPAFTSFRSGSCCCSTPAMAHKHSSSLWGVQSCWGSTEKEGKLIFKAHHQNGVNKMSYRLV